jgi:hypothetical protein
MTNSEPSELEKIVYYFCLNNNIERKKDDSLSKKSSEAILCFIKIGSNGQVENIHILADNNKRDSAFFILKRLQLSNFKHWKAESAKGKTVVIPIISLSPHDKSSYVNDLIPSIGLKPTESGNLIILRGIVFSWLESRE